MIIPESVSPVPPLNSRSIHLVANLASLMGCPAASQPNMSNLDPHPLQPLLLLPTSSQEITSSF